MPNIAQVFIEHFGLTVENAPWAFERHCPRLKPCEHLVTARSPFDPAPGSDVWIGTFVRRADFFALDRCDYNLFCAAFQRGENHDCPAKGYASTPAAALALALMAADPALDAKVRAASDWKEVSPAD